MLLQVTGRDPENLRTLYHIVRHKAHMESKVDAVNIIP